MKRLLCFVLILVLFGALTAWSVFVISSPWVFQTLFIFVHSEGVTSDALGVYALTVPFWDMFIDTSMNTQLLPQEMSHLEDVKKVLGDLFGFGLAGIVALIFIWKLNRSLLKDVIRTGIKTGVGGISVLLILSMVNWSWFFTQFHRTFFTEGTWQFPTKSVLIQLFPQQFWTLYGIVFVLVFLFTVWRLWAFMQNWGANGLKSKS